MGRCSNCGGSYQHCKCATPMSAFRADGQVVPVPVDAVESTPIPRNRTESNDSTVDAVRPGYDRDGMYKNEPTIPPQVGSETWRSAVRSICLLFKDPPPESAIEGVLRGHFGVQVFDLERDRDQWKRKCEEAEARIEKIRHALNTVGSVKKMPVAQGGGDSEAPQRSPLAEHVHLLVALDKLMRSGRGETVDANKIRAASEKPWYAMTEDEQAAVEALSEYLYERVETVVGAGDRL